MSRPHIWALLGTSSAIFAAAMEASHRGSAEWVAVGLATVYYSWLSLHATE